LPPFVVSNRTPLPPCTPLARQCAADAQDTPVTVPALGSASLTQVPPPFAVPAMTNAPAAVTAIAWQFAAVAQDTGPTPATPAGSGSAAQALPPFAVPSSSVPEIVPATAWQCVAEPHAA
jgi:hypothetical protein